MGKRRGESNKSLQKRSRRNCVKDTTEATTGLDNATKPKIESEVEEVLQEPLENGNESVSGNHGLNSDLESLMREVLSNHLILKQIFKHVPLADLLQYALVNREWNFSARTVQREDRKCVAKVRKNGLCQDLKKLNALLKNCVNIPFNGLSLYSFSVSYNWYDHDCVAGSKNLDAFSTLLSKIQFKYLEMGWDNEFGCNGIPVLKKIFKDNVSRLEGLSLFEIEIPPAQSMTEYFNIEIDQSRSRSTGVPWLPKLRFLEILEEFEDEDEDRIPLVKEMICAAPQVSKLYGEISSKFVDFICQQDKLSAVKEYLFEPGLDASNEDPMANNFYFFENDNDENEEQDQQNRLVKIKKDLELALHFAQVRPKLGRMSVSTECMQQVIRENPTRAFGLVSEILTTILTSSADEIEELQIYHLDLLLLARLQIPALQRLRHMVLLYCPHLDWTLTQIDISKMFPNLESVLLYPSAPDNIDTSFYITKEMHDHYHDAVDETFPYPWLTVRKLEWNLVHNQWDFNRQINKIFPNIKDVIVKECRKIGTTCTALWTTWPEIESITLTNVDAESVYKSLDPSFTGMSKHQCNQIWDAILDGVDFSQYAKTQARPSMKDLKNLKKFRIEIIHHSTCTPSMKSSDEVFLTDVTKKCVLERMPHLKFEVVRQVCKQSRGAQLCRYSMEHLEPCAVLLSPDDSITPRRPHVKVFRNYC